METRAQEVELACGRCGYREAVKAAYATYYRRHGRHCRRCDAITEWYDALPRDWPDPATLQRMMFAKWLYERGVLQS